MAFPATPLQVRVDMQVGGVWTDITADTLARDGASSITIQRGRADEASRADPTKCKLSLKNPTGKYSGRNPLSPYYGLIGRNTPLRVGIGVPPLGAVAVGLTGTSLAAPSVTAETASQLFCAWAVAPDGTLTVPGGLLAGTQQHGAVSTMGTGQKAVAAGATGTSTATFSTAATAGVALSIVVPGAPSSSSIFNTLTGGGTLGSYVLANPSATAGDYLLAVYAWSSDPGNKMHTAPRDPSGTCGWMLIADSGASSGPRIKAYIRRAPSTGPFNCYFATPPDTTSDTFVRVYVMPGATDFFPRITSEVSELPPKWDLSEKDAWVPVDASGIGRRLKQGEAPLRSALRREVLGTGNLVGYWPMEDRAGSTSFASAVGGPPMRFLGTPQLASDDGFACAEALPTFTNAGATTLVPAYTNTNSWLAGTLVSIPATGVADQTLLLSVASTGRATAWTVKYVTAGGGGFKTEAFDSTGTALLTSTSPVFTPPATGSRFFLYLAAAQDVPATDLKWVLKYVPIVPGSDFPASQQDFGGLAAALAGRIAAVTVGSAGTVVSPNGVTFGHVVASSSYGSLFTSNVWRALTAWNGESASDRVVRLCREESAPCYVQHPAVSVAMGPQLPQTLLELLGQCEAADGGILQEPRGFVGLTYRTNASLYDQSAALTLSYSAGHISAPFDPTDDDQGTLNDVTVNRIGGSSARVTLDVGPLSTLPPPAGVGRYDTSVDLNLDSDDQLPDEAAWRVHKGTWDEARYPSLHVDLAKNPSLIAALVAADAGDLATLTGLPVFVPPGPVDLLLEGYTETLGHPNDWDVTGNFVPAGPYRVVSLDSAAYGRLDSEVSTLAAGATTTAPTLSVATAAGAPLWTTTATRPSDFPFDVVVAGEVVTVTAAVGTASPQTFTVTRSVNGVIKAQLAGAQIRLARPSALAL